jgi:hypothetical protein
MIFYENISQWVGHKLPGSAEDRPGGPRPGSPLGLQLGWRSHWVGGLGTTLLFSLTAGWARPRPGHTRQTAQARTDL